MTQVLVQKKKPKWFLKLLEDLRKLLGKEKQQRVMLIETRHAIGKRILAEENNPAFYETFESIPKYMDALSDELHISVAELYAYVKFAEKFPNLEEFFRMHSDVREHQLSWHAIEHEILYPKKQPEERTTEPLTERVEKMCPLEKDLNQLLVLLIAKRSETLKCKDCPIREWCEKAKTKILTIGSELAELNA